MLKGGENKLVKKDIVLVNDGQYFARGGVIGLPAPIPP